MATTPRISIVVVNHDYARFLPASVGSALAQRKTYSDVQVIVVDDGSKDESRAVLSAYGDEVETVLKDNGGQASAMNAGFAASRGDLVVFLDADDFLFEDAMRRIAAAYEPGCSVVHYRLQNADKDGRLVPWGAPAPFQRLAEGDVSARTLAGRFYVCPPSSGNAFSRRFLEQVSPVPEARFRVAADFYLHALAPLYGPVRAVDERLGAYRIHGANLGGGRAWESPMLERNVRLVLDRADLIAEHAAKLGRRAAPELRFADAEAVSLMVALKLADPARDVLPEHDVRRLCIRGIQALTEDFASGARQRITLLSWFLLAMALPRSVLGRFALDPHFRLRSPI